MQIISSNIATRILKINEEIAEIIEFKVVKVETVL